MDDQGDGRDGGAARSVEDFVGQLQGFAEQAMRLATGQLPARPGRANLPALPSPPGAMSAAQLHAAARTIGAQRRQIAAVIEQLSAFDEQLEVLERLLEPLVEWSSTWADLEGSMSKLMWWLPNEPR